MSKIKTVSAGIVPVRKTASGYIFLMLRSFGTFWDFPKGHVENGETYLEAAKREALEEASLASGDLLFAWGKDYYVTEPFKRGTKVTAYFLAATQRLHVELPVNEELGKPEHDAYRWLTYEEAQKLTNKRIGGVLRWANGKLHGKQ